MEGIYKYSNEKPVTLSKANNETVKPAGHDLLHHIKYEMTRDLASYMVDNFEKLPLKLTKEDIPNPQPWQKDSFLYKFSLILVEEKRIKELLTIEKKYKEMIGETDD